MDSTGKYRTHLPFRLSSSMATMVAGGPPLASLQSREKITKDHNQQLLENLIKITFTNIYSDIKKLLLS